MNSSETLFDFFGGIRKMARVLNRPASTVHGWKKEGRIPASEQPHVLTVGVSLGLPITAEHIVFPLGRPCAAPDGLAAAPVPVAFNRASEMQRKEIDR